MADVLGIDIGGVIMDGVKEDRQWQSDPPAIEGAFDAVTRLQQERFRARCWLVSRCKAEMEPLLQNWLDRHHFFDISGIDPRRVVFCQEPSEKAEICRELEITHFIDDRLAVLTHMIGEVPNLYWFLSRASELEAANDALGGIQAAHTWTEITDALLDAVDVVE